MRIIPRSEWGMPEPATSRPKVPTPCGVALAHYVGPGTWPEADHDDIWHARKLRDFAAGAGKPFEYNYLIGNGGSIFEMAGLYRASHCLNFNDKSFGICFMLSVNSVPSLAAVEAWKWLLYALQGFNVLKNPVEAAPHYRYRATACPGRFIAEPPGHVRVNSPTGQGSEGKLLPPFLEPWTSASTVAHVKADLPILAKGMTGKQVRMLQDLLVSKANQAVTPSSYFDLATETAVLNVQRFLNLPLTGTSTEEVWEALLQVI